MLNQFCLFRMRQTILHDFRSLSTRVRRFSVLDTPLHSPRIHTCIQICVTRTFKHLVSESWLI